MGYSEVKTKIISALMGRLNGTEIQPDKHQEYALSLLEYVRGLELGLSSGIVGIAYSNTVPIQPSNSRVCYTAGIAPLTSVSFNNFRDQHGYSIQVTTPEYEGVFVILMWNTQYWEVQTAPLTVMSTGEVNVNVDLPFDGKKTTTLDNGRLGQTSFDDDYIYVCVKAGAVGEAIWKKTVMFQSL